MQDDPFTVVIEPDKDAYHAYVPALPGCHSFGKTVEEAQANIKEAIALHIECMNQDDEPQPLIDWEARWDALARKIGQGWRSDKSAQDILTEMRR